MIALPIVHLTSDRSKDAPSKRTIQLTKVKSQTKMSPHCLIIGDFNFGDGKEQDSISTKMQDFIDVWLHLHPKDPGYTFDPIVNAVAKINSKTGVPRRLDRVLLRSDVLIPESIEIVGNKPFQIELEKGEEKSSFDFFISDHYGLFCQFKFK
jgi:hypothetical protein